MVSSAPVVKGHGLEWLVCQLDARNAAIDETTARHLLTQANLSEHEIAPYVERRAGSYARHSVVRRENYELLVLTWCQGQGSVAHDHSGSLCGLKVVEGSMTEQLYACGPDGQVRPTGSTQLAAGQITVDPGVIVHALSAAECTDDCAAPEAAHVFVIDCDAIGCVCSDIASARAVS